MASQSVNIPGLTFNFLSPGYFPFVNLGAYPSNNPSSAIKVVIIGDASGGDTTHWPVNTLYGPDTDNPIADATTLETAAGLNSEVTQGVKVFKASNPSAPVYMIFVADLGTKGVSTLTITGTATKANTVNLKINGNKLVQIPVKVGDTSAALPTLGAALANAKRAEFTATGSGAITVTAGSPGVRNTPTLKAWLGTVDSGLTLTVANASTPGMSTIDLTTAMTLLNKSNKIYVPICLPSADESATTNTLELLATTINTQAAALANDRMFGFGGMRGSFTALTAYAIGSGTKLQGTIDNARMAFIWHESSPATVAEIVCKTAACVVAKWQQFIPNFNMCNYGLSSDSLAVWGAGLPLGLSDTNTTDINLEAALEAGVTPIRQINRQTCIYRLVTTHSYDAVSGAQDQRIVDAHKTFACDYVADQIGALVNIYTEDMNLADDLPNPNDANSQNTVTPLTIQIAIMGLIDKLAADGWIEDADTEKSKTFCIRDPSNSARVLYYTPTNIVDILAQVAGKVDQVG